MFKKKLKKIIKDKEEVVVIKEPKVEEVKVEIKEEVKIDTKDNEQFTTTDNILVEKLQNKFNIISVVFGDNHLRTFTFNATNKEVNSFLQEGI